ncbi:MAG: sulfotransferase, partial [Anaerolineae bacterium]|nr:sulfotransferase [Anaerolineae bacterium]
MKESCQPVFLIGAARSGTKLLRDIVSQHPDVEKIPYDINYIWRFGNEKLSHDELTPSLLTPQIIKRIRQQFETYHAGRSILIEKTVSNCLRIPFVAAVFPQAKFIHLIRHGEDVVESAYRQWIAPPDWNYIFEKARTFPLLETPGYALRYIINAIH